MQKNEIIIRQFVKTIKESPLDVKGDPVLLNNIFEAMEKKKKRRRFLAFFMVFTFILTGAGLIMVSKYYNGVEDKGTENISGFSKHKMVDLPHYLLAANNVPEETAVVTNKEQVTKKVTTPVNKKGKTDLTVSYKFNNHQVDVTQNGTEEFIQINVFGSDGSEIDVFEMMEEFKESYKNKELYVDSVNNERPRTMFRTVRSPEWN